MWFSSGYQKLAINSLNIVIFRCLILFGGGLIALFGAHLVHYDGAGGLATITLSFVAGIKWRKEGWGDHNPVFKILKTIWRLYEPMLFALIGTEIQVRKILNYNLFNIFLHTD